MGDVQLRVHRELVFGNDDALDQVLPLEQDLPVLPERHRPVPVPVGQGEPQVVPLVPALRPDTEVLFDRLRLPNPRRANGNLAGKEKSRRGPVHSKACATALINWCLPGPNPMF